MVGWISTCESDVNKKAVRFTLLLLLLVTFLALTRSFLSNRHVLVSLSCSLSGCNVRFTSWLLSKYWIITWVVFDMLRLLRYETSRWLYFYTCRYIWFAVEEDKAAVLKNRIKVLKAINLLDISSLRCLKKLAPCYLSCWVMYLLGRQSFQQCSNSTRSVGCMSL